MFLQETNDICSLTKRKVTMDQQSDELKSKEAEDEKIKKERKEAQDKIDKLNDLLESRVHVDSSLENVFQNLDVCFSSSDRSWIKNADKETKEAFLNKLRLQVVTNKEFANRKSLSQSEVISNTSALSGKLFTNNVNDFVKERKAVLRTLSGIKFMSPRLTQTDETKEFQSHNQRDQFNKCLSTSGWGTAADITAAGTYKYKEGGIGVGYGYENKQQEERENVANRSETYFSRITCSVMPTALWEPQHSDVSLSEDALTKLRDIEKYMLVQRDFAKSECESFLKKFGSHVYLGAIHLGGIYKLETNYQSNQNTELTLAKEMVQSKHSESVNASFSILGLIKLGIQHSGHKEEGKADETGKFENIESSKVHTSESKVGGPQEVSTLPLWKQGLVSNNSTWVVVDGGKFCRDHYTPVWELVQRQSKDFSKSCDLVQFLIETWENLSGMSTSKHDITKCQINSVEEQWKREIERISQCLNSEKDAHALANIVCSLCSQVRAMEKTLDNTNIWQNELQKNSSMSEFLIHVIKQEFSKDDEIEVRRCTEQLLAFSNNVDFPHRQEIHLWLHAEPNISISILTNHPCGNIEEFNNLMKQFLKSCRVKLSERESYVPPDFTLELGKAVESLVFELHQAKDYSQVLYLYSLLIPIKFDVKTKDFEVQVTVKDLQYLSKKLEHSIPQYNDAKSKGEKWLQAWILKGLLSDLLQGSSSKEKDDYSEANALSECSKVIQLVTNENLISNDCVKKSLIEHDWGGDIESLIESLSCILVGKDVQCTKTLRWTYFEENPSFCDRNQKDAFIRKAFHSQSDATTDQECRPVIPDLVKTLNLSEYFPGKLTVENALTISNKTPEQSACTEDLPWLMLKTIITGNFKFRESVLEDLERKVNKSSTSEGVKETAGNLLDMLADGDSEGETTDNSESYDLHPLDVLFVLYICCDAFLKGLLAQKIFSCQLAIPFIHKNFFSDESLIFSLWPLRGIITTTTNHTEQSVVTQDTNIISFLRLGETCQISKSKFINDILRNQSETHNTFYHRDCMFGMRRRTISDGMVEITWYLPPTDRDQQEKQSAESMAKHIQQPLTILNLRGNAVKYRKQTDAILHISRIVVVFVEFEDLRKKIYTEVFSKIHASGSYVILFTKVDQGLKDFRTVMMDHMCITKMDKSKTHLFSTFDFDLKREYNAYEMKQRLNQVISDELTKVNKTTILETACQKYVDEVCCDEMNKNCTRGKELAMSVFSPVEEKDDYIRRKEIFLPLQGERFWREWTRLQKENYRSGKSQSDEQKDRIWKKMMGLREAQVQKLNTSPDVIASFIEILIENIDNNQIIMYFLAWLKGFLDDESRRILPHLRNRLHVAFHGYEEMKSKREKAVNSVGKKPDLEEAKDHLACASLGLEHFYRELAQIYEAFIHSKQSKTNRLSKNTLCLIEILPYLAAKLLLLGQPLELMDGDAANVPQRWTEAVFASLTEVIKNRKIVSISVLGIQSSGKSTLLNTMFGLQFSVSAGRCTRGVFVQLLPICSVSEGKEPSYAVIIDTEGLRAPESAGKALTYDNELATLVIGLADIIIINIKGETMGEMENVLQIVVHELLRLKQAHATLDLCQSVIMVHQNVSAQDAASHLEQGNLSIVTNLNKVTKEAASQACMTGIESFKDVIQFNSKDHVKYISDLWLGNPPMAPVNPRYCSQASEVVDAIFLDLVSNQQQFLSVEDTSIHLKNLWAAILAEDFVFSFCNGLQIKAYNLLENEFLKQKWCLETAKMEWEEKNITPKLKQCENEMAITKCGYKLAEDFRCKIKSKESLVLKNLDAFLKSSDLSQHMADWQENKQQRLKDIADDLIRSVQKKIKTEKDQCKHALKQDTALERRKKYIYDMATTIAKSLKGEQPTEENKKRQFQDFWRKEVIETDIEVDEESQQSRNRRIKHEIESLLRDHFKAQCLLIDKELKERPLETLIEVSILENSLNQFVSDEHISSDEYRIFKFARNVKNIVTRQKNKYIPMAIEAVNLILRDIDRYFSNLRQTDIDYDKTQFSKVLYKINNGFTTHNRAESNTFKLNPALEVLVAVQAARFAIRLFQDLSSEYQVNHSIKAQLEAYRPSAWQLFEDILGSKTNEIIIANAFCLEIKSILRERIKRHLPNKIESKIRLGFGDQKHALIKMILEELSEAKFEKMSAYISSPESYVYQWLESHTNKIVFGMDGKNSYYAREATQYLSQLIDVIKSAISLLRENPKCQESITDWIESFKILVKGEHFILKSGAFKHVTKYDIVSFGDFSSYIQEQLCSVEKQLSMEFEDHNPDTIKWQEKTPYQAIFESLWGCKGKCPFCKEPCIYADPDHANTCKNEVHRCIQHRPSGIGGVHDAMTDILDLYSCSYLLYKGSKMRCGKWCKCTKKGKGKECTYAHNLRDYKKYLPEWEILPNSDNPSGKYWAWCMVQFSQALADKYGCIAPEFPDSWRDISKEAALESLNMYH